MESHYPRQRQAPRGLRTTRFQPEVTVRAIDPLEVLTDELRQPAFFEMRWHDDFEADSGGRMQGHPAGARALANGV